jgi:hypothetical protein
MKYYQGTFGIWMVDGDTKLYLGTGVHRGLFRIDKCIGDKFAEPQITREQAIKFCSKWPEAIAKINELDPIAKVRYFDGCVNDFWLMISDRQGWFLDTDGYIGIDLMNKYDPVVEPIFVKDGLENPHTDLEQLEIVKGRIAGLKFRRTDANGVTSEHEGPFDFVNFRYAEYEPTPDLEQALAHFFETTGIDKLTGVSRYKAEVNGFDIDLGTANFERLQKALRCYQTNKGQ